MLWMFMRLLAGRPLEPQAGPKPSQLYPGKVGSRRGWDSIDILRGNREAWPEAQIQHWKRLVEPYLNDNNQPRLLTVDEFVDLVCKEKVNSFGLYPGDTAMFPLPDPPIELGVDYGLGVYPRPMILNHSYIPNASLPVDI
ncbi:hypothetical protein BDV29DRAFT_155656 [Aspergillus leporis]|uniref:SET domain-containing protein n=1 Tax=Aspergillus leporis TaxID=41062 RepID=A0A5N5X5T7_9EURO|nr:hypothetical protein BDV29DRAFT_155656 [Aspergillus leporis]